MIHFYSKCSPDGTWRAYSDADNLPVCEPTTMEGALRVARELGEAEHDRAWEAASPFEREAISNTSGT